MFSNKDLERYSRQIILKKVGILGQKKIQNSKVLVVGCGGLGSPVIDLLSRAGIGKIGMMDHDKVSLSNLHRQIMFTADDVGKYKVNILKKKISKINKKVKVKIYRNKADKKNLGKILKNQLRDKILIIDLLNLTFRQANFSKKKNCVCGER